MMLDSRRLLLPFLLTEMIDPKSIDLPIPQLMGSIHEDRSSPSCIAMCRDWIRSCEEEHPRCQSPYSSLPPRRLLWCSPDAGVRLCPATQAHECRYLALSYCWGGMRPLATTVDTLSSHELGIPMTALPKLYRDVVILARSLDIPYVWIDSLCIVQDEEEDRDREIARMGDIFSAAFLVVIAASARSPQSRILHTRSFALHGEGYSSFTWRHATTVRYDSGLKLDTVRFREKIHLRSERDACQLERIGQRVWTYQERLLARRCLIFKRSEIVWECKTWCRCECSEDQSSLPPNERFKPSLLPSNVTGSGPRASRFFAEPKDAYVFWKQAVKAFSSRRLSYATDRLPAISALAECVSAATGDKYLAGLWKGDLVNQLMWQNWPAYDEMRTHEDYIAPSWSWASTPAPTFYRDTPYTSRVEVIFAWCTLAGWNPFGAVTDGAIVLKGVHCQAKVRFFKKPEDKNSPQISVAFDDGTVYESEGSHSEFSFLDGYRVKTVTMLTSSREVLKTVQRVPGPQPDEQAPCAGNVRLLWLADDLCLILAYSQRELGAFERLGILDISMAPPMPDLPPSEIKLL